MGVDLRPIKNAIVVTRMRKSHRVAQFMGDRVATGITMVSLGHRHFFSIVHKPDSASPAFIIRQFRMGLSVDGFIILIKSLTIVTDCNMPFTLDGPRPFVELDVCDIGN
ncbi:hypothetical protein H097_27275 [Pseudomonas sp. FH4]|nr:hypothetical protein H097_27275 [Pseudomonas sp. FH4]